MSQEQYSFLVAAVIVIAVVRAVIAGIVFFPRYFFPEPGRHPQGKLPVNGLSEEG